MEINLMVILSMVVIIIVAKLKNKFIIECGEKNDNQCFARSISCRFNWDVNETINYVNRPDGVTVKEIERACLDKEILVARVTILN